MPLQQESEFQSPSRSTRATDLVDLLVSANLGSCSFLFNTWPESTTGQSLVLRYGRGNVRTNQLPIPQVLACMDRYTRDSIEARADAEERIVVRREKNARWVRIESWEDRVVVRRVSECNGRFRRSA